MLRAKGETISAAIDTNNLETTELSSSIGLKKRKLWSNLVRIVAALIGIVGTALYNIDAVLVWGAIGIYLIAVIALLVADRFVASETWLLAVFIVMDAGIITLACYAFGTEYSKISMFYIVFLIGYLLEKGHKWGFVALVLALSSFLAVMLLERHGVIPMAPCVKNRAFVMQAPDRLIPTFAIVTICLTTAYVLMTFTLIRLRQYMKNERQLLLSKWAAQEQALRLKERLDETLRLEGIGRLAGGVAHDFNNLLTCILGYSRGIYKDAALSPAIRGDLKEVIRAAERAAHLTAQLLAFSRKQIIKPQVLDMGALVLDLEKMLSRIIGEDIAFDVKASKASSLVEADPTQVEQIVVNLIANARDAMPNGGNVTATVENTFLVESKSTEELGLPGGDYVKLMISDTGQGMAPETQARIFEPFFTTKELGKGTGLGLATVYGIVKQNQGAIHISSTPGIGTTFCVYLKRVYKESLPPPPPRENAKIPAADSTKTILVVEDEEMVRRVATRILKRQGYNVIEASNGEEAIQITSEENNVVDLLLTDVIMPGISGKTLADTLKKRKPGLRVLFMSGYTDNAIAHHGVLDSETAFLEKPFTAEKLITKVLDILNQPGY